MDEKSTIRQVAFRQTTERSPAAESMLFHPGTDQYGELTENPTLRDVLCKLPFDTFDTIFWGKK
jgi:hypothetical protein